MVQQISANLCKTRIGSKLLTLPAPSDVSTSPRSEPRSRSRSCLHFYRGMGLLLKIFIPLLGVALAFYFYSAPENFSEGKSLEKHALKPQSGRLLPERQCVPTQKGTGH